MSQDTLYRLSDDASLLVTEELMRDDDFEFSDEKLSEYRTDTDLTANLSALGQVIDYVIGPESDFDRGDEPIDAAVAPAVREFIDIPLREAGDPRIWHYLAIGWRPDFVRYRWPRDGANRTHRSMTEKFLGSTQDLYTNAFSRLWFMAEFSRDGDDYSVTEEILKEAYKSNRIFDRMDLRRPRTGRVLCSIAVPSRTPTSSRTPPSR
ncbi:DUF6339 family protein [Saliphagus sp. GCM10025308]